MTQAAAKSERTRVLRESAAAHRAGQSMLELVAATVIISMALVPALKLTRSSLMNMDTLEKNELAVALCVSKLEEEMAQTGASWDPTGSAGDFSSVGHADIRFLVTKSDSVSQGGSPDSLAVVDVIVWHDADNGNDLDADEPQTRFSTKLAKVLSYEYEAFLH